MLPAFRSFNAHSGHRKVIALPHQSARRKRAMRTAIVAMLILGVTLRGEAASPPSSRLVMAEAADTLSAVQHAHTVTRLQARIASMQHAGILAPVAKSGADIADLAWPLQSAPGFNPYGYY